MLDSDISKFSFESACKGFQMFLENVVNEDPTVAGYVFVPDMSTMSMALVTKSSISSIKKYLMYIQVNIFAYGWNFRGDLFWSSLRGNWDMQRYYYYYVSYLKTLKPMTSFENLLFTFLFQKSLFLLSCIQIVDIPSCPPSNWSFKDIK